MVPLHAKAQQVAFHLRPKHQKKCLTRLEANDWLHKHVPYRLVAAISLSPIAQEWDYVEGPNVSGRGLRFVCANYAMQQGQCAAIRWLIEFVGIQRDRNTKKPTPSAAARENDITDCGIWLLPYGENMLDTHPGAQILADIWKGCAQAVSHPTISTGHPDILPAQLVPALRHIITFLQDGIYRDYHLPHVVHEYCRMRHAAMNGAPQLSVSKSLPKSGLHGA